MTTWRAVTPDWVPVPAALADLHVLAHRGYLDTWSTWHDGMAVTAAWLRGGRSAPVTFREEQSVTWALADAEKWAAVHAHGLLDGPSPRTRLGGR